MIVRLTVALDVEVEGDHENKALEDEIALRLEPYNIEANFGLVADSLAECVNDALSSNVEHTETVIMWGLATHEDKNDV